MKKIIFVCVLLLIAGCTSYKKQSPIQPPLTSKNTIRVGVPGTLSGDLAPYGICVVRGCELAAEDINSKGGIIGKKLEIIPEDDQCRPELAVKAAVNLVKNDAQVIIGHLCSGSTIAANRIYKNAGLMVISPTSCNDDLTLSGKHPNFFRTIGYDDSQAKVMASFAKNNLNARRIALIHDKGDYGAGIIKRVRKNLIKSGGMEIVLFEGIDRNHRDYSKIVEKIKKSKADLTVWGGYHLDGSKIIGIIKEQGVSTKFFGCDGILNKGFINMAGKDSEGVYSTGPINTFNKNHLYNELILKHQKKYGEDPGVFIGNAYAALQMFAIAANKAGSLDLEELKKEMKSTFIETPIGEIKFDNNGDFLYREDGYTYKNGFGVFIVKNQKFSIVRNDYTNL
ncbi:MAG: branched-chain amino acid ABC transporter substrate-binding protein [Desulfobacterales bacterium]|nr:branched-chain amino acid ABC transporter substrate-binding protein [Desulfobacterales bacterium]